MRRGSRYVTVSECDCQRNVYEDMHESEGTTYPHEHPWRLHVQRRRRHTPPEAGWIVRVGRDLIKRLIETDVGVLCEFACRYRMYREYCGWRNGT